MVAFVALLCRLRELQSSQRGGVSDQQDERLSDWVQEAEGAAQESGPCRQVNKVKQAAFRGMPNCANSVMARFAHGEVTKAASQCDPYSGCVSSKEGESVELGTRRSSGLRRERYFRNGGADTIIPALLSARVEPSTSQT